MTLFLKFFLTIALNNIVSKMDDVYECSVCEEQFIEAKAFLAHHFLHPNNDQRKFECVKCLKRFKDTSSFRTHITRVHENKGLYFNNLYLIDSVKGIFRKKSKCKC